MRKVLTLAMFVGTIGTLAAQTPTPATAPDARVFSAGHVEVEPAQPGAARRTVRMSGGVVLVLKDGTRVTADEATMNADGQTLELSGNVRMTFPTPTPTPQR
jgi:lipopolysaccharide assembly outer membrane protein LptD (OstA)